MDKLEAMRIASSDATVSDKIRALAAAGYPRAEIARLLGKRYQHVRNVLEGDKSRRAPLSAWTPGVAESPRQFEGPAAPPDVEDRGGGFFRLTVRGDGSVVLPPPVREALGVNGAGIVLARLEGEEFKVIGAKTALARIREALQPHLWKGGPLASDELIAERRAEAARDG